MGTLAEQLAQQAIGEIVEIVQALAQIGIGLAQHARARIRLHAQLDRGLRGEAGHHRFVELVRPAAIVGEVAIGFEHVAMLAAFGDVSPVSRRTSRSARSAADGGLQPFPFLRLRIVGDEVY